ncbi:MAG: class B sortase [Anaerotruncus sp.]|nr:MAG: class B sortase [Anaerotruncus sp.]
MLNRRKNETTSAPQTTQTTEGPLAENPVDFASLQSQNSEIYAWIKIDDTDVDYPIVQSGSDDDFYLRHSAFDKKYLSSGAIYTQGVNRTDFTDPIMVVYGHNGYKETMFTTLHKFEDSDFFNSHEYFYIYMPQHKLTYQIISAFKYDDRHIMNSFNFYDENDLANFQAEITNPSSALKKCSHKS